MYFLNRCFVTVWVAFATLLFLPKVISWSKNIFVTSKWTVSRNYTAVDCSAVLLTVIYVERVSCWMSCSAQSICSTMAERIPELLQKARPVSPVNQAASQRWFKDVSPGQALLCEDDQLPFYGMQSWFANIKRWQHATSLGIFFARFTTLLKLGVYF